jgi:4'-phosphopantetheinyl transferase
MMLAAGLAVCWWPGRLDVHEGPVVIGVDGGAADWGTRLRGYDGEKAGFDGEAAGRGAARARVRVALREALGQLAGLAPDAILLQSTPGCAPAVSYPGREQAAPGVSISHDEPLSLAAIHLHGAVGVDLMRVQAIPDWRAVARDYLGPHATALLEALPVADRAAAFARAWCAHEARLKCHGLQLAEWTPRLAGQLDGCHCRELALPAGIKGAVAWRGKA